MADRYFSHQPIASPRVALCGDEGHHLVHVMRARPGLEVTLFDGSGAEFLARVEQVKRDAVELAIVERRDICRESPLELTLAVALPKGERQKWLVEKAVELGVRRLCPFASRYSVSEPTERATQRLRRAVIEASKQCGRNRLMEILEPMSWSEMIERPAMGASRYVAHRSAERRNSVAEFNADLRQSLATGTPVLAAIGPEGGFSEEEIGAATAAGWKLLDLGPRILRVETAAATVAALCLAATLAQGRPLPNEPREGR